MQLPGGCRYCRCLTWLPLSIVLATLSYLLSRFAEPTERMMWSGANIMESVAVMFQSTANVSSSVSKKNVDQIDGEYSGITVREAGGDARLITLGPMTVEEISTFDNRHVQDLPVPMHFAMDLNRRFVFHHHRASASRAVHNFTSEGSYDGVVGMTYLFKTDPASFYMQYVFKKIVTRMEWANFITKAFYRPPTIFDTNLKERIEHYSDAKLLNKLNTAFWQRQTLGGPEIDTLAQVEPSDTGGVRVSDFKQAAKANDMTTTTTTNNPAAQNESLQRSEPAGAFPPPLESV